jgi:hypothetical protein
MPKMTRPFESWSSDETSFAVVMGSRSISRQMPVASLMVVVTAAAAIRATKGSWVCQYSFGRSPPAG